MRLRCEFVISDGILTNNTALYIILAPILFKRGTFKKITPKLYTPSLFVGDIIRCYTLQ